MLFRRGAIGHREIVLFQPAGFFQEVRAGEGIVLPDFRRGIVVQDHVHFGQRGGRVVHLLPVDRDAAPAFVGGFQQQGAAAAGRIIDALVLAECV